MNVLRLFQLVFAATRLLGQNVLLVGLRSFNFSGRFDLEPLRGRLLCLNLWHRQHPQIT